MISKSICILGALSFLTTTFAANEMTFDSAGVSLRYLIDGEGETVVLLHGFSGSAEGLYIQPGTFNALVEAGYRAVALDQRGHGKSQKPHDPDQYGLTMVEDIRRLLNHLDIERTHLVGYSMGAKVTNTFRDRYPDRLITVALGGYGWPWQSPKMTLEQSKARLKDATVLPGNDLQALAAVRVGMFDLVPSMQSLQSNQIPAFAIIGDRDQAVPLKDQDKLERTMTNLRMLVVPGTHAGPDGAPYKPRFAEELIQFLDEHRIAE